jgi:hypothetical protein
VHTAWADHGELQVGAKRRGCGGLPIHPGNVEYSGRAALIFINQRWGSAAAGDASA